MKEKEERATLEAFSMPQRHSRHDLGKGPRIPDHRCLGSGKEARRASSSRRDEYNERGSSRDLH